MDFRFSDQPGAVGKILILLGLFAFGLFVYQVSDGSCLASVLLFGVGFMGINQKLSRLSLHDDNLIASTTFNTFKVGYKDVLSFGRSFYPAGAVYLVIRVFRCLPVLVITGQVAVENTTAHELGKDEILAILKKRTGKA